MPEKIIRKAYARLGLMGNPTDALGGCAIAVTISDFWAEATLQPSKQLSFKEPNEEKTEWKNIEEFQQYINLRGYQGGRRLMLALLSRLIHYCKKNKIQFEPANFTLTWKSIIPLRVGMGGSSALITASFRAIADFWKLEIPKNDQVEIILRTETEELGIPAGYNDRVSQVYEGLTFYELDKKNHLKVELLNPKSLPCLFIAINESSGEGTEIFHSNLRARFEAGDPLVLQAIQQQSVLARKCRDLLKSSKGNQIGSLMDENYKIRQKLMKLNPKHQEMVKIARNTGAYAKFAGSGGTIVGTCEPDKIGSVLKTLQKHGYLAFQPKIKT